jgi:CheY-like chemotaxis protein
LAVVARIVEQLGGQLRVDSKVDQGSRFSFLIPLALVSVGRSLSISPASSGHSSMRSATAAHLRKRPSSGGIEIDSLVEALSSNYMGHDTSTGNSPCGNARSIEPGVSHEGSVRSGHNGKFEVTGSKNPIRPVRVAEFDMDAQIARSRKGSYNNRTGPSVRAQIPLSGSASANLSSPPPSQLEIMMGSKHSTALRVLIVEVRCKYLSCCHNLIYLQDNVVNRKILGKRLSLDGCEVLDATNGQEGLDTVELDRAFDCILMDIQYVTQQLRCQPYNNAYYEECQYLMALKPLNA